MGSDKVNAIIAIIVVVAFFVLIGWLSIKLMDSNALESLSAPQPVSQVPAEKPITKTRCDYTGFMAPSIIEEEAQQGYFYTGRVQTFLCDDAMVFQLREVK